MLIENAQVTAESQTAQWQGSRKLMMFVAGMLALIGGIGDGTVCFVVDDLIKPSAHWIEWSRFGPGLMLGLLSCVWIRQWRALSAGEAATILAIAFAGWGLAVVVMQWAVLQEPPVFWGMLLFCSITGALCMCLIARVVDVATSASDGAFHWRQLLLISVVTGMAGAWLFVGIAKWGWLSGLPLWGERVAANVALFTPWSWAMLTWLGLRLNSNPS